MHFFLTSIPVTNNRLENRCVLRHISDMNFQSWAVLGSQGCRERNATFKAVSFVFMVKNFYIFKKRNTLKVSKFQKQIFMFSLEPKTTEIIFWFLP